MTETAAVYGTRQELARNGFALVEDIKDREHVESLLKTLGSLVPQYDGTLSHEVKWREGNDDKAYSQSRNAIRVHTEAPGWSPSPHWLALHCHTQACCGGGHTALLDLGDVFDALDPQVQRLFTQDVWFPAPRSAGNAGVRTPMLTKALDGRRNFRFSYNLLTTGEFDPVLDAARHEGDLPLGGAGASLAREVSEIFERLSSQVLIPDDALLIWDNRRMAHARSVFKDTRRHLTRYWITDSQ